MSNESHERGGIYLHGVNMVTAANTTQLPEDGPGGGVLMIADVQSA